MTKRGQPAFPVLRDRIATLASQRGFVLLPVVLALVVVAIVALLLSHESAINANMQGGGSEADQLRYVAEAAFQHADWAAQNSGCTGDLTIPTTPFGEHTYSAAVTATGAGPSTTYNVNVDQDAWLKESSPAENHGSDVELSAKKASGDDMRTLYRYDLSGIPAGSQVNSATAWYYITAGDDNGPVNVHRVTSGWTEASANWSNMSANYDSQALGSFPSQDDNGVWVSVNLTSLVQAWVDGTTLNQGIMFVSTTSGVESKYTSKEWSNASERPWMEVVVGTGSPSPVSIAATGTHASGAQHTLAGNNIKVFQPASNQVLQPGAEGKDGWITSTQASWNYGGHGALRVNSGSQRALIQFDLATLPAESRISSARMELYLSSSTQAGTIDVHAVTDAWVEGTCSGSGCTADGATWDTSDGGTAWTAPGGDHDPTAVTSQPIGAAGSWYGWDITPLAASWVAGELPNHGVILRGFDGVSAQFASSDAADASVHPRLTITYACECGIDCSTPVGAGTSVLLVVVNPASLTPQETAKKSLMESWGYAVNLIDVDDPQSAFDAATAVNDVVFITEDITASNLNTKLVTASIGVVTEEDNLSDEFGFSAGIEWESGTALNIDDNAHYITAPFALGPLSVFSSPESLARLTGAVAPDLIQLASASAEAMLVALDAGASVYGGGTAAGRRVQLPWGGSSFDVNNLTADGLTIFQRSLQWGAGAGVTPTGPIAHWKLDDGAGFIAIDSVGGHDGGLVGPTWTTGLFGDALSFDDGNDWVTIPDDPVWTLDPAAEMTWEAWIKPTDLGEQWNAVWAQTRNDARGFGIFAHTTANSNMGPVTNGISVGWDETGSDKVGLHSTDNVLTVGNWHHVAVTHDGSLAQADRFTIFVDGVDVTDRSDVNSVGFLAGVDAESIVIGGNPVDAGTWFGGIIDDVRYYDTALSAAEIAEDRKSVV